MFSIILGKTLVQDLAGINPATTVFNTKLCRGGLYALPEYYVARHY
jgi:hypothetical protein